MIAVDAIAAIKSLTSSLTLSSLPLRALPLAASLTLYLGPLCGLSALSGLSAALSLPSLLRQESDCEEPNGKDPRNDQSPNRSS